MEGAVLLELIKNRWIASHGYMERQMAGVTEDMLFFQPVDGKIIRTPGWLLGHLSMYGPVIRGMLLNEPFPNPRETEFGSFTMPERTEAKPGELDELLVAYLASRDSALEGFAGAGELDMSAPNPLERLAFALPTLGDMLMHMCVVHPEHHGGHMYVWRQLAGLTLADIFAKP